jgi:hypothetical protein
MYKHVTSFFFSKDEHCNIDLNIFSIAVNCCHCLLLSITIRTDKVRIASVGLFLYKNNLILKCLLI